MKPTKKEMSNAKFRWRLMLVVRAFAWLLQIILFFPTYWLWLITKKDYWFLDTTDHGPYGYGHSDKWKHYGKEKWWVAFRWCCFRNPYWNLINKYSMIAKGEVIEVWEQEPLEPNKAPLIARGISAKFYGKTRTWYKTDQSDKWFFIFSEAREKPFKLWARHIHTGWYPPFSGGRHVAEFRG